MKKQTAMMIGLAFAALISGCANMTPRDVGGLLLGGLAGAAIGAAIAYQPPVYYPPVYYQSACWRDYYGYIVCR